VNLRTDGWKISYDGSRSKIIEGPCWAVVTYYRGYAGREVPESHVVESLHKDRPDLERLIAKYQYPAPGSIKQYDFAYGRMASAVSYRSEPSSYSEAPEFEHDQADEYVPSDAEDEPGIEKVYRKVEVVRLSGDEVRDLYLDWARSRVVHEGDPVSLDFALHVLAELGGEA
jgi:hypothetical protein